MIWPFKRKKPEPEYVPDSIISAMIACNHMRYVSGTDLFTVNNQAWAFTPDGIMREDGFKVKVSPTARMFLAAHLNRCPTHTFQ